jgi:hypothetical protein
MPELSFQNIDQISCDIRRQEITFSHLLEDLIDHVCCDVEYEMQKGLNFPDAYNSVKKKMGSRRLKEIQEETLYAVDTKYRNMKNTMKISGVAGTVMLGFAAIFKIMHWPFAGIMMTIGALVLAFIFLPSALGVMWKETHSRKRLFLFISTFITGMLFIFGILFKIQHWQGAGIVISLAALSGLFLFIPSLLVSILRTGENRSKKFFYILGAIGAVCYVLGLICKIQHWPLAGLMMVTGLVILFLIVFPWYTWYTWKDETNISARFIFILVGSLAIIIPAALVNLNMQRSYNNGFFIHMKEQQAVYNYKFLKNQTLLKEFKDSLTISVAEQIHNKTIDLINTIDKAETNMVAEAEGKPGMPALDPPQIRKTEIGSEIQYDFMTSPFSPYPVKDFLLPGCKYRQELESALTNYFDYLTQLPSGNELKPFKGLLDPAIYFPGENPKKSKISLINGLHSLILLKNSVLTLEFSALTSLVKQ